MKKHNFCAGPCLLPEEVYLQAAAAIIDYEGTGLSILSISHRSDAFLGILAEAKQLVLELLGLDGKGYEVLFLQGGASMEFLRVPFNLLNHRAGYINTGVWSMKAIEQAKGIGEVSILASSEKSGFTEIPVLRTFDEPLDYLHFTSNNTIYGTQFKDVPKANCPIVCDMSSDIYSREFAYDKIDLIYAGAQKNIGPAGISVVLVKKDLCKDIGKSGYIPAMLDYKMHLKNESLYHTANVFAIYTALLNFRWLHKLGGVGEIAKINRQKASLLYEVIDSLEFIEGIAKNNSRSDMNITFKFSDHEHAKKFDDLCLEKGISNIKGHRVLGGYRASLYNAVSLESVEVLCDALKRLKTIV